MAAIAFAFAFCAANCGLLVGWNRNEAARRQHRMTREQIHYIIQCLIEGALDLPAIACCFFAASSCSGEASVAGFWYDTGALEMLPGVEVEEGSRRLAYKETMPPDFGGEEESPDILNRAITGRWSERVCLENHLE